MARHKLNCILNSAHAVYSFDLFDTLLFRRYYPLDEVVYRSCQYLSAYLRGSYAVSSLVEERKQLSQTLKRSVVLKTQEPKLVDILSALVGNHELVQNFSRSEVVSKTISFELSLEKHNLQVNPQILELLNNLKSHDKHIICITDMYFDHAQILSILDSLNIRHFFKDIFVSSQIGLTKQTGDLFNYVVQSLDVRPNQILHLGDKLRPDMRSAKKSGLDSKLVFFRKQLKPAFDNVGNIHKHFSLLSAAFLIDLIQTCHSRNIYTLFFLSRDATALGMLCRSLVKNHKWINSNFPDLRIRDLDISRASTAFLELEWEKGLENIISLYLQNIGAHDLNTFLDFFNLPAQPTASLDNNLASNDWARLIRAENSEYEKLILEGAENKNQLVIEYLEQTGAIHAGNVAFIDIGYAGTITRRISTYLQRKMKSRDCGDTRIHCFFLLSNNHLAKNAKSASPLAVMDTSGFLNRMPIPGILRGNGVWLEAFYQDSVRGPLLEYTKNNEGKVRSVFSAPITLEKTIPSVINAQFIEPLSEQHIVHLTSHFQSKLLIKSVLKEMSDPSIETMRALKNQQYLSGNTDQNSHPLITSLASADLLPQNIKSLINNDYWLSGSIRHSGFAWLIPIFSAILSTYYQTAKFSSIVSGALRTLLAQYGKPIARFLFAHLGIIKSKQAP